MSKNWPTWLKTLAYTVAVTLLIVIGLPLTIYVTRTINNPVLENDPRSLRRPRAREVEAPGAGAESAATLNPIQFGMAYPDAMPGPADPFITPYEASISDPDGLALHRE